jgi:hypothetical protein
MNNHELSTIILSDFQRIVETIATEAQWEIWMQAELLILLKQFNVRGTRKVPYPAPNSALHLDLLLTDNVSRKYAIELKVESATNAATGFLRTIHADAKKIVKYTASVTARWVVAICYNSMAKNELADYASDPLNNAIFNIHGDIGCLVKTV